MNQTPPQLFDTEKASACPGYISPKCRFYDDAPQRLIFVDGELAYAYDTTDRLAMRQVWTMVYMSGLATYAQIATATDISIRALKYWIKRYRKEGATGLPDRARSGAPRKVTPTLRKKIYHLRAQRLTYREIAQRCQISDTSVANTLRERRANAGAKQQQLSLLEDEGKIETATTSDAHNEDTTVNEAPSIQNKENEKSGMPSTATTDSENKDALSDSARTQNDTCDPPVGWDDKQEASMAVDRSADRLLASAGIITDAEPLFAPRENLEFAGAFMAVAAAATDPFLHHAQKIYGHFAAAFYGVRTLLLLLVVMALLRIKRPEWLRRGNPEKLGRVLGLDRVPEVKTLRRRLRHFERFGRATKLMYQLAKERSHRYEGATTVVQVDGHQLVYHGKEKVGEVFSSRCKKVVKAETDNWVSLPNGFPLLVVTCEFNQGLSQVLFEVLETTRRELGVERLSCCFDRGGYNILLFEQLIAAGFDVITYRKGVDELVPKSCFPLGPMTINNRTYPRGLYERNVMLQVYEPIDHGLDQKPGRHNTKRTVEMREIRILRHDGGQTTLLTSCSTDTSAEKAASLLFDRIGSQENGFKYLRQEFLLDALPCYGSEPLEGDKTHPNPIYTKLEKKAGKLRRKRDRILGKYADALTGIDAEAASDHLRELRHDKATRQSKLSANKRKSLTKDAKELEQIKQQLEQLAIELKKTPAREKLTEAGYKRLKSELRQFMNVIKISAYHIETDLVKLLSSEYANHNDEARSVIAAALRSSGSLRLEPGRLVIQLEPQAEPRRTRAINHVTAELTAQRIRFPGSQRLIVFKPTPVPPPPASKKSAT